MKYEKTENIKTAFLRKKSLVDSAVLFQEILGKMPKVLECIEKRLCFLLTID